MNSARYISNILYDFPGSKSVINHARYFKFILWRLRIKTKNFPEINSSKITLKPERIKRYLVGKIQSCLTLETRIPVLSGDWDHSFRLIRDLNESEKLDGTSGESSFEGVENGIAVAIDRNGDFLLTHGLRLLLAMEKSPQQQIQVDVIARHSKWFNFKKELFAIALEKRGQPATHPDCDLPNEYSREEKSYCENRFELINRNLAARKGNLLDIGSNYGYFCHKFEEIGFDCYAVEKNPIALYYMKKLWRAENRKFKIISQDVLTTEAVGEIRFDVVLALNIFHHFLKRRKTYEGLIKMLNKLQTKEMFFEPHIYDEPQMKGSYKNYAEEDFIEFILQNSRLKNSRLIGVASDGRKLYKLF